MAVTRLAFQLQNGSNYIDLANQLSVHMRTLIRQKQVFTVVGGMIVDNSTNDCAYTVSTLPNTWWMKAGINRCFRHWKYNRATLLQESAASDSNSLVAGKYSDFKIWYNSGASSLYRNAIVTGVAGARPTYVTSEWDRATFTNEAGAQKDIMALGDHTTSRYGALKGWVQTREIPNALSEPDMADLNSDGVKDVEVDFLATLHDTNDGQAQELQVLYDENDRSPFFTITPLADIDNAHNSTLQCFGYTSSTNPQSMIPGFKALCGLLHVEVGPEATTPILFLDVMNTPERF